VLIGRPEGGQRPGADSLAGPVAGDAGVPDRMGVAWHVSSGPEWQRPASEATSRVDLPRVGEESVGGFAVIPQGAFPATQWWIGKRDPERPPVGRVRMQAVGAIGGRQVAAQGAGVTKASG